jgi:hypothetical protein
VLDALAAARKAVGNLTRHGDGIVAGRAEAFYVSEDIGESLPFLPHCKRFTGGPPASVSSLDIGSTNIKSQP